MAAIRRVVYCLSHRSARHCPCTDRSSPSAGRHAHKLSPPSCTQILDLSSDAVCNADARAPSTAPELFCCSLFFPSAPSEMPASASKISNSCLSSGNIRCQPRQWSRYTGKRLKTAQTIQGTKDDLRGAASASSQECTAHRCCQSRSAFRLSGQDFMCTHPPS